MVSVMMAAAFMLVSLVISVDLNSYMRCTFICVLNNALEINSTYYIILKVN
jgi:hypothetical protein